MKKGNYKRAYELFAFWNLKFVPIDSALNSASGNPTHFRNVGVLPRKEAKLENPVKKFSKMSFVICSCKTGEYWNQNVFKNL